MEKEKLFVFDQNENSVTSEELLKISTLPLTHFCWRLWEVFD